MKSYRFTPNVNCPDQKSPAEVLLGRKMRTTFDQLKPPDSPQCKRNIKMEKQFNKKHGAKKREFNIDDTVFVMIHKGNSWHWEEGWIIDKIGFVNYSVATKDRVVHAHANQIKPRFPDAEDKDTDPFALLSLFEVESNC